MMKSIKTERSLSAVAALLLFAVFAVGILSVLFSGAKSYNKITSRDRKSYEARTTTQYVMTKLRQAEAPQSIRLGTFGDGDALKISQTAENKEYITYIYCHDGWLMELFAIADGEFSEEDGERVLKAESLTADIKNNILKITVIDSLGESVSFRYALKGSDVTE